MIALRQFRHGGELGIRLTLAIDRQDPIAMLRGTPSARPFLTASLQSASRDACVHLVDAVFAAPRSAERTSKRPSRPSAKTHRAHSTPGNNNTANTAAADRTAPMGSMRRPPCTRERRPRRIERRHCEAQHGKEFIGDPSCSLLGQRSIIEAISTRLSGNDLYGRRPSSSPKLRPTRPFFDRNDVAPPARPNEKRRQNVAIFAAASGYRLHTPGDRPARACFQVAVQQGATACKRKALKVDAPCGRFAQPDIRVASNHSQRRTGHIQQNAARRVVAVPPCLRRRRSVRR